MTAAIPPASPSASKNAMLGILFMCLAVTIFPFLNMSVKYLAADYPVPQIVWIRYTGHLLFMLLVFMPRRGFSIFRTRHVKVQLLRSLLLFGSTAFYFTGLLYLPLATAASINFTGPFVVIILSSLLLGEKVGPYRWGAVAVGFIGAMIIIRPGGSTAEWAMLLTITSMFFYSFYQIVTRRTVASDDSATTITYTAIVGAVVSFLAVPFVWVTPMDPLHWGLFLLAGFCGGFGHYMVVKSLEYAEASLVAPFGYGQLIGAVALGYFVFGDFPDVWTFVGAFIIVVAGIFITYRERLRTVALHKEN